MRSLKARLKRLEEYFGSLGCPGCAARQVGMHHVYTLPGGQEITLPPIPKRPPCTCRRPRTPWGGQVEIISIEIVFPDEVESREEAKRLYAENEAGQRRWQSGVKEENP